MESSGLWSRFIISMHFLLRIGPQFWVDGFVSVIIPVIQCGLYYFESMETCVKAAARITTPRLDSYYLKLYFRRAILRTASVLLYNPFLYLVLYPVLFLVGLINSQHNFFFDSPHFLVHTLYDATVEFVYALPGLIAQSLLYPLLFLLPCLPSYSDHNLKTIVFVFMAMSIFFHFFFTYILFSVSGLGIKAIALSSVCASFVFAALLIYIIHNIYPLTWSFLSLVCLADWNFLLVLQSRGLMMLVTFNTLLLRCPILLSIDQIAKFIDIIGFMFLISSAIPVLIINDNTELDFGFGIKSIALSIVWATCNFVALLITQFDLVYPLICFVSFSNPIIELKLLHVMCKIVIIVASIRHFIIFTNLIVTYISNKLQQGGRSRGILWRFWSSVYHATNTREFSRSFSYSDPAIGFFNLEVDFAAGKGTIRIRCGDIESEDNHILNPRVSNNVDSTIGFHILNIRLDFEVGRGIPEKSLLNRTIRVKFDLTVGDIDSEGNHSLSSYGSSNVDFSETSAIGLASFPSLGSHNPSLGPIIQEVLQHHNLLFRPWPENNHVDAQSLPSHGASSPMQSSIQHQSSATQYTTKIPPLIKGRWKEVNHIGSGAYGRVFHAINKETGASCAIKVVKVILDYPKSVECLKQESKILRKLSHPNIVKYYGRRLVEDNWYLYMEYVHPGSIKRFLPLAEPTVRKFTCQLLLGLDYLHKAKIIHRDIKCANILMDANESVKLADFGLAKATKSNDDNSFNGTAFWMAPEVVKGKNQGYGFPADIWSLGCTVLEMLTGQHPYPDLEWMQALYKIGKDVLPPVPDSLSRGAQDFILQCLQVNPNDRPTAAQLLNHPFVQ